MRKILIIILLAVLFTFIPITIIWAHYQFVTGLNPFLAIIITPFVLLIAFLIYRLLIKIFKRHISFTPDVLFAIGLFSCLILIFVLQIFYGNFTLGIHLHDTYFVMSNSYPLFFIALAFAVFSATYYLFNKIFKKQMNYTLGYIHFWISFLGISFIVLPIQYAGFAGMPRRYYDYGDSSNFNAFSNQITFVSGLTFFLIIAQLLFVFNFCYSILRKPK
ncbi:MAG: cbb3-type cytochrome c oxidase subunit I [Chitinophagaceae bacterium]|nr:cbb3-type cytochrome c oxidase subunit I [Chitinophagaceae bacterium]MCW5925413.1 cbb3-type cytochrome c oxidase subunit I [Chitinophagaceae bacterium]